MSLVGPAEASSPLLLSGSAGVAVPLSDERASSSSLLALLEASSAAFARLRVGTSSPRCRATSVAARERNETSSPSSLSAARRSNDSTLEAKPHCHRSQRRFVRTICSNDSTRSDGSSPIVRARSTRQSGARAHAQGAHTSARERNLFLAGLK